MKKKIVAALLAASMALSLTACGGENTSNTEKTESKQSEAKKSEKVENQDVALTETGYSINNDGMGSVYAYYGFTVNNPNADSVSQFPVVTVTAKGDDGSIIGTYDQTLNYIAPNDSVSFGSVLDCNGTTPATVEFSVSSGTFIPAKSLDVIPTSSFAVSNANEIADGYGSTSYTGEVANNSGSDSSNVAVTVIVKNNGAIVYGSTTYVSDLTAGSTKPFELSEYNVPEHTEYVVTAHSWD